VRNVCYCCARTGYKNTSIELAWDCHGQSPVVQKIVSSEQKFSAWYKTMQMAIHSTILCSLQISPPKRGRWCIGKCSEIHNHVRSGHSEQMRVSHNIYILIQYSSLSFLWGKILMFLILCKHLHWSFIMITVLTC
jgi:hypothetical protein